MLEESPEIQDSQEIEDQQQRDKSILREVVETVLLTLLIFLAIRTLIQNFRIEGVSMEPNLHDGQYLIINKLVYYLHPPERGDIVVFHYPKNPQRDFIKRIIEKPKNPPSKTTSFLRTWLRSSLAERSTRPKERSSSPRATWSKAISSRSTVRSSRSSILREPERTIAKLRWFES